MNKKEKERIIKKIVIERIRSMSPNVRISLGSEGKFMGKDKLLDEVNKGSPIGKKVVQIQLRYMRALKGGKI